MKKVGTEMQESGFVYEVDKKTLDKLLAELWSAVKAATDFESTLAFGSLTAKKRKEFLIHLYQSQNLYYKYQLLKTAASLTFPNFKQIDDLEELKQARNKLRLILSALP